MKKMTRQPTNQVAFTELFILEDVNGDSIVDVNADVLYVIGPAQPFSPKRN